MLNLLNRRQRKKKHVFILMCHVYFYFYIYDYDNRVPAGLTFQIIRQFIYGNKSCIFKRKLLVTGNWLNVCTNFYDIIRHRSVAHLNLRG